MDLPLADADLAQVDLFDLDLFADGPPHQLFERMRKTAPVSWVESSKGGFWSVTRAADIETVSKNPELYSSYEQGPNLEPNAPWPLEVKRLTMIGMDPPEHTKYRLIVQRVFTQGTVNKQADQIRARVNRLLDDICEKGSCDFVTEVATELPLQTIAGMLGVPHDDRMQLFEWTQRIEAAVHDTASDDGLKAFGEMGMYLVNLINARRESPRDDLISQLIQAEVDGEHLNDQELTAFFGLLMFAGNDTTRNTSSGGLLALLEHPEQKRQLIDDPSLIPSGVEEMLRWVSAVVHFRRTAMQDTELGGVQIKKGDAVIMWYSSGSRDEDLVEEPARFDVTRTAKHQAFGGGGRHFCIGNQLGRLQLRILFEELLRRLPDIELDGDIVRTRSNFINGIDSLPVKFTPAPRQGSPG